MEYLNNKSDKFKQLKIIVIRPDETIDDFNKRFLELYHALGNEHRQRISVYDYMNAIRNRMGVHQALTLKEPETIEKACRIAKDYEYWQEYNFLNYGNSYINPQAYYPPSNMNSGFGYPAVNRRSAPPNNTLFPNNQAFIGYAPFAQQFSTPMTMPTYPMTEPMTAYNHQNTAGTFPRSYNTSNNHPRSNTTSYLNRPEIVCYRCGQPGHLQKDCGRLNH